MDLHPTGDTEVSRVLKEEDRHDEYCHFLKSPYRGSGSIFTFLGNNKIPKGKVRAFSINCTILQYIIYMMEIYGTVLLVNKGYK